MGGKATGAAVRTAASTTTVGGKINNIDPNAAAADDGANSTERSSTDSAGVDGADAATGRKKGGAAAAVWVPVVFALLLLVGGAVFMHERKVRRAVPQGLGNNDSNNSTHVTANPVLHLAGPSGGGNAAYGDGGGSTNVDHVFPKAGSGNRMPSYKTPVNKNADQYANPQDTVATAIPAGAAGGAAATPSAPDESLRKRVPTYLVPVAENPDYDYGVGEMEEEPQYEAVLTESSSGAGGGVLSEPDESLRKRIPSYLVPVADNPDYAGYDGAGGSSNDGSSSVVYATYVSAEMMDNAGVPTDYDLARESSAVYDTAGDGGGTEFPAYPRSAMQTHQYEVADSTPGSDLLSPSAPPLRYEYADAAAILRANSVLRDGGGAASTPDASAGGGAFAFGRKASVYAGFGGDAGSADAGTVAGSGSGGGEQGGGQVKIVQVYGSAGESSEDEDGTA